MRLRRSRSRERGASLVEFALLLPLLALLLFGTITGGLALSRQNSVKNAVREASRFAAVSADYDDVPGTLDSIYEQVVASATGDLDPGVDGRQICVAIVDSVADGNDWSYQTYGSTNTATAGSGTVDTGPAICTDAFDPAVGADHARIWISASRTSEIDGVLYEADWNIDAHALTRYER